MKWRSLATFSLVATHLVACGSSDESDLYGTRSGDPGTGGMPLGGMLAGGMLTGGMLTGGMLTGGMPPTGGIATTGGASTGGSATGGAATGGTPSGGTSTGGQPPAGGTGGQATDTGGTLPCPQGSETCPCYDDYTCDAPLTCASGLCVDLTGIGGTGGTAAAGGAPNGGAAGAIAGGTNTQGGARGAGDGGAGGAHAAGAGGLAGSASTGGTETGGAPPGGAPTGGAQAGGAPAGGNDGGGNGGGSLSACSAATMDPCSIIPRFTETQLVDGDDSEFCSLPSFTLDFVDNNDFVQIDHPGSDDRPETAAVRLGWSATGLHVFITVTDPYLVAASQLSSIWDGDGVELFFTTDTTLNGNPAIDAATHVAVSADPSLAASVSTIGGVASHSALQLTRYETTVTAEGYTVELRLPWRSSTPTSGARIAFDLALDSADNDPVGAPDGRDAQAILYLGTPSSATTCPAEARPWCDDRTWCTPTLE